MSVYRPRKSPYWHFDFQIHGYRFSGSTGERRKAAGEEVEKGERRKAEQLLDQVRKSGKRPLTFAAAADQWWREVGAHGTETDIEGVLRWLKSELGEKTLLHEIGNADVTRLVNARRTHVIKAGKDSKGKQLYRPIMPRTVNRTVPLLIRRIMRRAIENWDAIILRQPEWDKHLLPEVKRPIREITRTEESAIEAAEFADFSLPRRLSTILGLRLREVLLTWPQVDFENAILRIIGKGGVPRIVPLNREAYEILWSRRGHDPLHVFTFVAIKTRTCAKSGKDFVRGTRYPVTYYGLSTHRRRKFKKAGVDARYHDTRHTAGMRTLRATGNLKLVQKLLGHSDITTTAKFYTDALVEDVREGLETTARDVNSRNESRTASAPSAKGLKS